MRQIKNIFVNSIDPDQEAGFKNRRPNIPTISNPLPTFIDEKINTPLQHGHIFGKHHLFFEPTFKIYFFNIFLN